MTDQNLFTEELIQKISSIELSVPVGGPIRIQRLGKGYVVSRGSAGLIIKDEPDFPYMGYGDYSPLSLGAALELANRVVDYMITPPSVEEVTRWADEFADDESEGVSDRHDMANFLNELVQVIRGKLAPEKALRSYRSMDTFVREAVPDRFKLPLREN
jgi:hypothetical protein